MSDFDWKGILGRLAPTAATLLAGPFAGMAVSAIGNALGIDEPTQTKIEQTIKNGQLSGEQLTAIKLAEQQLALKLEELGVRREELIVADRDSARKMQETTNSRMPATLTLAITAGFFGVLSLMLADPHVIDSPPLMIMLGSLGTAWTAACSFWLGTTNGSMVKTNLLAQSTPGNK